MDDSSLKGVMLTSEQLARTFTNLRDNDYAGVQGGDRLAELFLKRYHCEGARPILRQWLNKIRSERVPGPPKKQKVKGSCGQQLATKFGEIIIFDHTTLCVDAVTGHEFLLVIKDAFSKFIWLVPCASMETNIVAEELLKMFKAEGILPAKFQHDNARSFWSDIMKRVADICNAKQASGQAYNPQPQGSVERENKTVKEALVELCQCDVGDRKLKGISWVKHLEKVRKIPKLFVKRS